MSFAIRVLHQEEVDGSYLAKIAYLVTSEMISSKELNVNWQGVATGLLVSINLHFPDLIVRSLHMKIPSLVEVVKLLLDEPCLGIRRALSQAWFRELSNGVLDSLSPEQVMQAESKEECAQLMRFLPSTEAALLDWAINLMVDVAQFEKFNKMNAQNVAMVFVPNMIQMADPLTALMYAVEVMNFLKTLIVKTRKDREESVEETGPAPLLEPSDEDGHSSSSKPVTEGFFSLLLRKYLQLERTIGESPEQVDTRANGCEEDDTNRSAGGAN